MQGTELYYTARTNKSRAMQGQQAQSGVRRIERQT